MIKPLLFVASAFFSVANAVARTSPPSGSIVVAKSGGNFNTIQAAVNSISTTSTTARVIFIQPGTYSEQVLIPALAGKLTIYGYTTNDQDYNSNQVTITAGKGADTAGSDDASGTLRVKAKSFAGYNLNIVNSRGSGVQAIALSAYGGNQGYYGCKIVGYQDTVLANTGIQVYDKCYIEGATDFIFGQTAIAWFEKATIAISGRGYITASGRDSSSNPSYYVLNNAKVVTKSGVSLASGSTYLGRPWRNYARVTVQNSNLGSVVNSAGWAIWNTATPNTDHVAFSEYGNTGTGASGTRASFSTKLSSAVSLSSVVGSTSWIDMTYWNNSGTPTTTDTVPTTTAGSNTTSRQATTSVKTTTSASGGGSGCESALYGQCGGTGWTGCTRCASGSTCTASNEWYSQCI